MTDDRSPPDALRAVIAHELESPGPSEAVRERIHARLAATVGIAAGAAVTGVVSGTAKAASANANATGASANAAGASAKATRASAKVTGASVKVAEAGAKIGLVGGKLVVLGVVVSAVTAVVIATRSEPARSTPPNVSSSAPRTAVPGARAPVEVPSPSPNIPVGNPTSSPNVGPEAAPVETPLPPPNAPAPVETPSPPPNAPALVESLPPKAAPKSERTATPRRPVPDQAALLARAWTALSGGNAGVALELVELDLRNHPSGPLDEERDALRIRALVELGRLDEARTLTTAFAQRYPTSIQLSLLERLTKTDGGKQ